MTESLEHPIQSAVLHIASPALLESVESRTVEQWVDQAGLKVVRCGDVYLGLARALGNSSRPIGAVIVCVEDFAASEYEFFALVARARRDLPVLVYGPRSPERVVRALESGARGLATRDAILALGSRIQRLAEPVEPAFVPPVVTVPQPVPIPPPVAPTAFLDSGKACSLAEAVTAILSPCHTHTDSSPAAVTVEEVEDIESEVREDADSDEGARVPWLRYSGGPERKRPSVANEEPIVAREEAPVQKPEAGNGAARVATRIECEREYEPLLTEQELAALLADDLDDMAMQEREMLTGEGEVPGSGTR